MKTTLLLSLALVGCGGGVQADVTSPLGSRHYLNGLADTGVSSAVLGDMERQVVDDLAARGFDRKAMVAGIGTVETDWAPTKWKCASNPGEWCLGASDSNLLQVARVTGCPWLSAYRHELIHMFQISEFGVYDYSHGRPEWVVLNDVPSAELERCQEVVYQATLAAH